MDIFQAEMMQYEKPIEQALVYLGYRPINKAFLKKFGPTWLIVREKADAEYCWEVYYRKYTEPETVLCYTSEIIHLFQDGISLPTDHLISQLIEKENYCTKVNFDVRPMDELKRDSV